MLCEQKKKQPESFNFNLYLIFFFTIKVMPVEIVNKLEQTRKRKTKIKSCSSVFTFVLGERTLLLMLKICQGIVVF